jgi:ribosomal protein S18 acetylase RimI-like enzyme
MDDFQHAAVTYREARAADAPAVAAVHVRSWRGSFAGVVPQAFLDKMSVERRTAAFAARFSEPGYGMHLAESAGTGVVGFADYGEARGDLAGYEAELYAIYLLPEYQRRGVGRELFRRVAASLAAAGKRSLCLLALEASPYRSFYEKLGGRVVGRRTLEIEGVTFGVSVYGWEGIG